jgi:hypothetical protein
MNNQQKKMTKSVYTSIEAWSAAYLPSYRPANMQAEAVDPTAFGTALASEALKRAVTQLSPRTAKTAQSTTRQGKRAILDRATA